MANQEDDYRRAANSGDAKKAAEAYERYRESMERSGQKPKDIRDL